MRCMIQKIIFKDKLLAILIKANFKKDGIEFFTPDDFSQQLAYMNRPKGYVIAPHSHKVVVRSIRLTEETLYIKSGKLRVDFYDGDKNYLESRILEPGDVIFFAFGGHGFEMLENSEIIEVKQGPYIEKMDKVRFQPVSKDKLKVRK